MAGIVSYGEYIPLFRLGKATAGWEGLSERAIANFDEDSVTMAVAALRDALTAMDAATIDALYFASTTQAYAEKQSATRIGWAIAVLRCAPSKIAVYRTTRRIAARTVRAEEPYGRSFQMGEHPAPQGPPGRKARQSLDSHHS